MDRRCSVFTCLFMTIATAGASLKAVSVLRHTSYCRIRGQTRTIQHTRTPRTCPSRNASLVGGTTTRLQNCRIPDTFLTQGVEAGYGIEILRLTQSLTFSTYYGTGSAQRVCGPLRCCFRRLSCMMPLHWPCVCLLLSRTTLERVHTATQSCSTRGWAPRTKTRVGACLTTQSNYNDV